jgi:hypothetical protein
MYVLYLVQVLCLIWDLNLYKCEVLRFTLGPSFLLFFSYQLSMRLSLPIAPRTPPRPQLLLTIPSDFTGIYTAFTRRPIPFATWPPGHVQPVS